MGWQVTVCGTCSTYAKRPPLPRVSLCERAWCVLVCALEAEVASVVEESFEEAGAATSPVYVQSRAVPGHCPVGSARVLGGNLIDFTGFSGRFTGQAQSF